MTRNDSHQDISNDAKFARDQQLAYDMQYAEEEQMRQQRLQQQQKSRSSVQGQSLFSYPGQDRAGSPQAAAVPPVVQGIPYSGHQSPAPNHQQQQSSLSATVNDDGSNLEDNSLLHVPCEVGRRVVEMMVDTGAQSSVISVPLMRTLGLERLLNRQYQGIAAGVGRARILGRCENVPVKIGHVEFRLFFLVLDISESMLILGIDQMKRFKCMIDLESNKLIFGGKDGVSVDFLPPEPRFGRSAQLMESCCMS